MTECGRGTLAVSALWKYLLSGSNTRPEPPTPTPPHPTPAPTSAPTTPITQAML